MFGKKDDNKRAAVAESSSEEEEVIKPKRGKGPPTTAKGPQATVPAAKKN